MSIDWVVMDKTPWWKGARGEWLFVIQAVLIGLVFLPVRGGDSAAG
jgi:hypothetical protein